MNKEKRIYELFSVLMHEGGAGKAKMFGNNLLLVLLKNTNDKDSKSIVPFFF